MIRKIFSVLLCLTLPACNSAQLSTILTNAPAALTAGLATAQDAYAAYAAANSSLNGQKISVPGLITAATAFSGSAQTTGLINSATQLANSLNTIQTELAAQGASSKQIVAAQSAQITAAQLQTQAVTAPAGSVATGTTTADNRKLIRIHYDVMTKQIVVACVE